MVKELQGTSEARPRTVRLSDQQRDLLTWIYDNQGKANRPVPWSVKKFLGDVPSNSQASAVSRTLSILEERRLVKLQGNTSGQRRRTTHVALTRMGRDIAEAVKQGHEVMVGKVPTVPKDAKERLRMLQISAQLIRQELKRLDAMPNSEQDEKREAELSQALELAQREAKEIEAPIMNLISSFTSHYNKGE